jgi:hypothetical protein
MAVYVVARFNPVFVDMSLVEIHRNPVEMAMPDFGFRHQDVGEPGDVIRGTLEQYGFKTVLVIHPHMHGRNHNVVIGMLQLGDALG